jgi:hypothetical protein
LSARFAATSAHAALFGRHQLRHLHRFGHSLCHLFDTLHRLSLLLDPRGHLHSDLCEDHQQTRAMTSSRRARTLDQPLHIHVLKHTANDRGSEEVGCCKRQHDTRGHVAESGEEVGCALTPDQKDLSSLAEGASRYSRRESLRTPP